MSGSVELLVMGNGHRTKRVCRLCGKPIRRRSGRNLSGLCQSCHSREVMRVYWERKRKARDMCETFYSKPRAYILTKSDEVSGTHGSSPCLCQVTPTPLLRERSKAIIRRWRSLATIERISPNPLYGHFLTK